MKHFAVIAAVLSATTATAGGFEASRLDTKFMYEEGNYAEVSHASLDYKVNATTLRLYDHTTTPPSFHTGLEKSVKASQSRNGVSFKANYGGFDVGLSRYKSGTIQLGGSAAGYYNNTASCLAAKSKAACLSGPVPETDVDMYTLTLMGKAKFTDEVEFLFGLNRNTLEDSSVTTTRGTYTIKGTSSTSPILGFAYSKPKIALRVEFLMQPSSEMKANTGYVRSNYGAAAGVTQSTASFDSTLSRPTTITLNFQSGVAKDTLVYGSIHRAAWGSAQIDVPTGEAASSVASKFWDTTTYTLGAARKISDSLALTASFAKETGGASTSSSLFTVNNGYRAISFGAKYTVGKIAISGGYNYTKLGDIDIFTGGATYATYRNNNVSALGLKIGYSF
jgi:hypothetical protein